MERLKEELGENFTSPLKIPLGTRDFGPHSMALRERVLKTMTETFKKHGAVGIDTPAFEYRHILLGKSGNENEKAVYDLVESGGDPCCLRFDLTVCSLENFMEILGLEPRKARLGSRKMRKGLRKRI